MANRKSKQYVKPEIQRQDRMTFPVRGLKREGKDLACRQCSSCHGCR